MDRLLNRVPWSWRFKWPLKRFFFQPEQIEAIYRQAGEWADLMDGAFAPDDAVSTIRSKATYQCNSEIVAVRRG